MNEEEIQNALKAAAKHLICIGNAVSHDIDFLHVVFFLQTNVSDFATDIGSHSVRGIPAARHWLFQNDPSRPYRLHDEIKGVLGEKEAVAYGQNGMVMRADMVDSDALYELMLHLATTSDKYHGEVENMEEYLRENIPASGKMDLSVLSKHPHGKAWEMWYSAALKRISYDSEADSIVYKSCMIILFEDVAAGEDGISCKFIVDKDSAVTSVLNCAFPGALVVRSHALLPVNAQHGVCVVLSENNPALPSFRTVLDIVKSSKRAPADPIVFGVFTDDDPKSEPLVTRKQPMLHGSSDSLHLKRVSDYSKTWIYAPDYGVQLFFRGRTPEPVEKVDNGVWSHTRAVDPLDAPHGVEESLLALVKHLFENSNK